MNAEKTRCCRLPEDSMTFLGYRIGRNYRRDTGRRLHRHASRAGRASRASAVELSVLTDVGVTGVLEPLRVVVARLNRLLTGWANYFTLGQVSPAYRAVDQHAARRLGQWLCRKHKVRDGKSVRFPYERLWTEYGLTRLAARTARLPWAKA